jgi:hypothetical protein
MRSKQARAGGSSGFELLENRVLFSNFPPIFAPTGLSAVARSATVVQLSWNAEFTVGEDGFLIERTSDGINWSQAIVTPPDAQTWLDSTADPETAYLYRISAFSDRLGFFFPDENPVFVVTPAAAITEVDDSGTVFIRRNEAADVVTVVDSQIQYDITVDGVLNVVNVDDASRIQMLSSTSDNGITIEPAFDAALGRLVPSWLIVRGTLGNDMVGIGGDANTVVVRVNETNVSFSRTLVKRISVLTYDGDDRISIGAQVGSVNVSGGNGNDTIYSNVGDDRLDGGAGDDLIKGHAGNDKIYGGAGDDTIYGQGGADYIEGNDGHDRLIGGIGNDILDGGDGNDRLYGEEGIDILKGGPGFNLLKQESP